MGRAWMAVRDMDVAASVIGIRLNAEQSFSPSPSAQFYCGVAGALCMRLRISAPST